MKKRSAEKLKLTSLRIRAAAILLKAEFILRANSICIRGHSRLRLCCTRIVASGGLRIGLRRFGIEIGTCNMVNIVRVACCKPAISQFRRGVCPGAQLVREMGSRCLHRRTDLVDVSICHELAALGSRMELLGEDQIPNRRSIN